MAQVDRFAFNANIPVLDLADYYNPEKKQNFIQGVSKAAREFGFFALVNTKIEPALIKEVFDAMAVFFHDVEENKLAIYRKELCGKRGYVPGEFAQEQTVKDNKEFIHIGKNENLWPENVDLKTPVKKLMKELNKVADVVCRVFSIDMDEEESFLSDKINGGANLLRPLHYPKNETGGPRASKHTDIDLITLLPKASAKGLVVIYKDQKIEVDVPDHALIVNCGDKLRNLSNGKYISAVHLVEGNDNEERFSIPYFVHPKDNDDMSPTPKMIAATTGVQNYPNATSLELLASRLRELNLATNWMKSFERESGIMDRVAKLVESGNAAAPVKLTYDLRNKNL